MLSILSFPFVPIGDWLRSLSLSGGAGNALAFAVYIIISLIPAAAFLLLKKKGATVKADMMLPAISLYLFFMLYNIINPFTWGSDMAALRKASLNIAFYSILIVYLVFRMLEIIRKDSSGKESLKSCMLNAIRVLSVVFVLSIVSTAASLSSSIAEVKEGNHTTYSGYVSDFGEVQATVNSTNNTDLPDALTDEIAEGLVSEPGESYFIPDSGESNSLLPTYVFLVLKAIADILPLLLSLFVCLKSQGFVAAILDDYTGDEALSLGEKLGKLCILTLKLTVLSELFINLSQLLLQRYLRTVNVTTNLPIAEILFTLIMLLVTRCLKYAKELREENESFI